MTLRELGKIEYSQKYGYYFKEFDHKGKHYVARLIPYPVKDSECVIRHITDTEDINNITAPEDAHIVYRRGSLALKADSLKECIKEFLKNA